MKPLNRAERNNSFFGFVILFLITIGIVITVVFFSLNVQLRENKRLRSRMLIMQNEKNLSDSFRVAMNIALNELTKFDSKKEPAIVTKGRVEKKIERMRRIVSNMPEQNANEEKSIYDMVIQNIADLNVAKARIINLEEEKGNN